MSEATSPASDTASPMLLTAEGQLDPVMEEPDFDPAAIRAFWDTEVTEATFQSDHENAALRYAYVRHPAARAAIVISSGRTEGYVKYKEVLYDFYRQGYSVYIHDHRGQGLSDRLLEPAKNHVGYVTDFQHYIDDLKKFTDTVVRPTNHAKYFLIAHSMGGAIASAYLQQTAAAPLFSASVMSSPMHGITGEGLPMRAALTLLEWLGFSQGYIPFAGAPYNESTARTVQPDDCCTHSQPRKTFTFEEFARDPFARLGGASVHWVRESIRATQTIRDNAGQISIPVLILSGGADTVVSNDAQQVFCDNMNAGQQASCQLHTIEFALHEHFIETHTLRAPAMTLLFEFLDAH